MQKIKELNVLYDDRKVGTLAVYKNYLAAFEYTAEWLAEGFSISPYSLPLLKKVFMPKVDPFDGVFGVFADSLPDGWGRLLVDRVLVKNNIVPAALTPVDRLAIVGSSGMGALRYEPEYRLPVKNTDLDLDKIAAECSEILATDYSSNLDELFRLGGSSGGARPKILTSIDGEDWIIKFAAREDSKNIGLEEYSYSLCAKKCGIEMPETRLFSSNNCSGYFGVKRFDRAAEADKKVKRVHMVSVSGLLETSHRIPNLDYDILMKLTLNLTKDFTEVEKMFRLMCFNVFAHNRDDHSKNFAFLYDDKESRWKLSPAYDLTYSNSIGGEHATAVHGNGFNPGMEDILKVADGIGMNHKKAKQIALDIQDCVNTELKEYLR